TRRSSAVVSVALWLALAPFASWAALRLTGWEPAFRWSQLVSFTPYAAAGSVVPPLVALALRRRAAAVAALAVAAALASAVLPRALPDGGPPVTGTELRVMAANLYYSSTPSDALMAEVRRRRPDVLVLSELQSGTVAELDRAGIAGLLPYRAGLAGARSKGTAIYSRLPIEEEGPPLPGPGPLSVPAVVTLPGGQRLDVVGVHTCAPTGGWRARCWAGSVRGLPAANGRLRVLAGDFNATLDHRVLRDLVATGYRDAADAAGHGLAMTWPYRDHPRWFPKAAIDHVLADSRIGVRGFATVDLPRSDHRAVVADLTIPREGA
ncbi:endonuclease/exonuclease/phosphatase family protein, partial [Microtetraspora fusca]|uniref:endonuclease/exonuclease/phosphatase family protein n=1 Tax=Microtetraspora fusca TaxID=1997 RepID=UPI000A00E46A